MRIFGLRSQEDIGEDMWIALISRIRIRVIIFGRILGLWFKVASRHEGDS